MRGAVRRRGGDRMRWSILAVGAVATVMGGAGTDGADRANGTNGADGRSCSVAPGAETGTWVLTCEDGTSATLRDGTPGADGRDGKDGVSCTIEELDETSRRLVCTDGTDTIIRDGAPGTSCTVTGDGSGTILTCTDGTSVAVGRGEDGTSCSVTDNGDGTFTLTCTDGTSATWAAAGPRSGLHPLPQRHRLRHAHLRLEQHHLVRLRAGHLVLRRGNALRLRRGRVGDRPDPGLRHRRTLLRRGGPLLHLIVRAPARPGRRRPPPRPRRFSAREIGRDASRGRPSCPPSGPRSRRGRRRSPAPARWRCGDRRRRPR